MTIEIVQKCQNSSKIKWDNLNVYISQTVCMVTFQINRPVKTNQKKKEVNGLGGRGAYGQSMGPMYHKYFLECKVWHFFSMSIIESTSIWTSDIGMCGVFQWSTITHWTATQKVWICFSCTYLTLGRGENNRHC